MATLVNTRPKKCHDVIRYMPYFFSTPSQPQSRLDARTREQLRRSRLLSLFLLVLFSVVVVLFPKSFIPRLDLGTLGGLFLCSGIGIGSILLNRYRLMNAAASVFVIGI